MEWKNSGVIIAVALVALILGMTLMYSLQKAQVEQAHERDIKCYIPAPKSYNGTTDFPITCYAPFFSSKTTINLTLVEKEN